LLLLIACRKAGVHNLHGTPGVFGGLVAMALVAFPLWQLTGIVTMGVIVGFIVSRLGRKQTPYEDKDEFYNSEENKGID
jgi:ammonium transporter Rh